MKIAEIIFGLTLMISISLKFLDIDGATLMLIVIVCILSLFYWVFSFALLNRIPFRGIFKEESYQHTNAKRIVGAILSGIVLSQLIIGILFKIQLFPGSQIILITGLSFTLIILITAYIFYFRNKIAFYRSVFSRIALYGGIALLLLFIPKTFLVETYFSDHPEYVKLYKKALRNPGNEELQMKLSEKRKELYDKKKGEQGEVK